ncbi:MAG: YqgE/AlgH family protein [Bacteroidota bacterium]
MNNIYFNYNNNLKPSNGCLLVSEPHLPDANFDRTVILLCKHDDEGSFGFVLNRPSKVKIKDILKDAESIEVPVYIGGPVEQNTLHFIHKDDSLAGAEYVIDNLYWGGNFDLMLSWLHDKMVKDEDVRFFLGYSGWASGQLSDEIEESSWMVFKPDNTDFIFETSPENMWKAVLKKMGGRFSMYAKYPEDPRLN